MTCSPCSWSNPLYRDQKISENSPPASVTTQKLPKGVSRPNITIRLRRVSLRNYTNRAPGVVLRFTGEQMFAESSPNNIVRVSCRRRRRRRREVFVFGTRRSRKLHANLHSLLPCYRKVRCGARLWLGTNVIWLLSACLADMFASRLLL